MHSFNGISLASAEQRAQGEALEREYNAELQRHRLDDAASTPSHIDLTIVKLCHLRATQGARPADAQIGLSPTERLDLCHTILEEGARFHHDTFTARDVDPLPLGRSPAYISPSTKFRMLEAMASAEAHLRLADAYNLAGLPPHLAAQLAQHWRVVEGYIDRRSQHLAPIRVLPVEILLQIFMLARTTLGTRDASLVNGTSQVLSFARVCRHWRDVCLHNGSLWASIDIHVPDLVKDMTFGNEKLAGELNFGRPDSRRPYSLSRAVDEVASAKPGPEDQRGWSTIYRSELLLGIHLCYSGSSPLTIRLSGELQRQGQEAELSDTRKRLSALMERLAQHSLRWRDVSIDGMLLDCLPIARGPFPALETLSLGRMSWRNHNFSNPFSTASKLSSFAGVTLFPPGIGIPWAQLHDIRLEGGINPLLDTLAVCENLRVCTIARVNKRFSGYPLPERTSLLDIHTLRLIQGRSAEEANLDTLGMMFQVLRLPRLETLEIYSLEAFGKRFRWFHSEFVDMVAESQCTITNLTLSGVSLALDEFFDLSNVMPALNTLFLAECKYDDNLLIDVDFFRRMSSMEFPQLRHLGLEGRMRLDIDEVIPAMVEARLKAARLNPRTFCPLDTLSITIRRRSGLHQGALVRLQHALREGFVEQLNPPPKYQQRPILGPPGHPYLASAHNAHGRRIRVIEALGDLSDTESEEGAQEPGDEVHHADASIITV